MHSIYRRDYFQAGECPLHVAARLGEEEMAETLLTFGAVTDVADARGSTALMAAAAAGHSDITALLLAHHADPHMKDTEGDYLFYAVIVKVYDFDESGHPTKQLLEQ